VAKKKGLLSLRQEDFVKEFILELSRMAVLAALPVMVIALESGLSLKASVVLIVVAVLKALDRALHESGIAEKGLTRVV